jgi:hypothetical protein
MKNEEFDQMLKDFMSIENSELELSPLQNMDLMRRRVASRKQRSMTANRWKRFLQNLINIRIEQYQVGFSMLIISAGLFWFAENPNPSSSISDLGSASTYTLVTNTVCVSSSTMLTSIPTLVIRN